MTEKMDQQFFNQKNQVLDHNLNILNHHSKKFTTLRLILFLFFVILLVVSLLNQTYFLLIGSLVFFIGFLWVVKIHLKLDDQIELLKFHKEVNLEYIARIQCNFNGLEDHGNDLFKEIQEPYLEDLDIFGDQSLYKLLSICKTKNARKKLRDRFTKKNDRLEETQRAVDELADKIDLSTKFQYLLKKFKKVIDKNDVSSENVDHQKKVPHYFIIFGVLLLLVFIASFIMFLMDSKYMIIFLSMVFIQVIYGNIVYFLCYAPFEFFDKINYYYYPLVDLYQLISKEEFTSDLLKENQTNIQKDYDFLKSFNRVTFLNALRKNFISNLIGNVFSLNIWISIFNNSTMKKRNQEEKGFLNSSLHSFENFQVFISLSNFNVSKQNVCAPEIIRTEKLVLDFDELKHPLISEDKCVSNSFHLKNPINIITGSNMSGKTSFLRVIGMNLILMNLGCKVNGKTFKASSFTIFTSMRIKDDFIHGISSFYSELLNIKKAIDYQKTNQNMICFIDEIFRGTNSNDRISGAISLIKQLNQNNVILFLTTHDFELCDIKIENIDNFHFEEHYTDNKIYFDYKIKSGKCRTTNAKYLMRMVGIEE